MRKLYVIIFSVLTFSACDVAKERQEDIRNDIITELEQIRDDMDDEIQELLPNR